MKIFTAILFFCFILFLYFNGNKDGENQKVSEIEADRQPEVVKDSSTTDWWELGSTDLGHWVQETLNLSSTEANIILWITFVLLLITFLSYILDLKALRGKIKINVSLGITLFFIISVIVYGIAFKGEAVQNWLNSASNTSWFGNNIDTKPRITFKKPGDSKEVIMAIGTQLTVSLPTPPANGTTVNMVCFKVIEPAILIESGKIPEKILENIVGSGASLVHSYILSKDLRSLMSDGNTSFVKVVATVYQRNVNNTTCP